MFGWVATTEESWRTTRRPVALPPACATRRMPWPPSRPSERLPSEVVSKTTPSSWSSATALGASRTRTLAAERRTSARPAVSVSRRCRSGESSGASAAARPPWAQ